MENNKTPIKNDLFIRISASKKAVAEQRGNLSSKITMVAVEVSEAQTETGETLDINIHLQTEAKLMAAGS
jgi:regulator of replication initiation timing